ncbi:MAG: DNA-binding protein [Ruminococcaceae bacterium]|nr:DNA-binding protein [Oscillospiraceae bacterium]
MFEKNLEIGYLLDFYGELLTDRKRSVMDMYYNEDFSLAEIAAEIDISRQGVRDIIKKSEEELFFYEEKLGLAKKMKSVEATASSLLSISKELSLPDEVDQKIAELLRTVKL